MLTVSAHLGILLHSLLGIYRYYNYYNKAGVQKKKSELQVIEHEGAQALTITRPTWCERPVL